MTTTLVARWDSNMVVLCQMTADKKKGWLPVCPGYVVPRGTHPAALLASLEKTVFKYVDADSEEAVVTLEARAEHKPTRPQLQIARATYVRSGTHAEAVQGLRVRMASYTD